MGLTSRYILIFLNLSLTSHPLTSACIFIAAIFAKYQNEIRCNIFCGISWINFNSWRISSCKLLLDKPDNAALRDFSVQDIDLMLNPLFNEFLGVEKGLSLERLPLWLLPLSESELSSVWPMMISSFRFLLLRVLITCSDSLTLRRRMASCCLVFWCCLLSSSSRFW